MCIRFGATPVFREIKASYADLIAVDLGRRAVIAAAGTAPCVGISIFPGAVISIDSNAACRRSGRQREVRGDNVLHNRLAAQRGLRTARLDLVGNLLENVVQRSRVTSREVVAGRAGSSVVGRNFLHEPVTGSRHFCFCIVLPQTVIIVIIIWLFSCGTCVSTGKNTYGIYGSSSGFDCIRSCNRAVGNASLKSIVVCWRTVCKNNYNAVARFTSWNRVGIQDSLCHIHAQVGSGSAICRQGIDSRIDHSSSVLRVHGLKNIFQILICNTIIRHTYGAAIISRDGKQLCIVSIFALAGKAYHRNAVID